MASRILLVNRCYIPSKSSPTSIRLVGVVVSRFLHIRTVQFFNGKGRGFDPHTGHHSIHFCRHWQGLTLFESRIEPLRALDRVHFEVVVLRLRLHVLKEDKRRLRPAILQRQRFFFCIVPAQRWSIDR
jgi:hypothetical protein